MLFKELKNYFASPSRVDSARRLPGENAERGIAMIEFAIAVPFIFALAVSVLDISTALNQYLILSQAAHEGAKYASDSLDLATGPHKGLSAGQGCAPGGAEKEHEQIQYRVERIMSAHSLRVDGSTVCITTDFDPVAIAPAGEVSVEVEAEYDAYFIAFDGLPLRATAKGPYMQ